MVDGQPSVWPLSQVADENRFRVAPHEWSVNHDDDAVLAPVDTPQPLGLGRLISRPASWNNLPEFGIRIWRAANRPLPIRSIMVVSFPGVPCNDPSAWVVGLLA